MGLAIFLLSLLGGLILAGFSIPRINVRAQVRAAAEKLRESVPKRRETARDYVARVNGVQKENPLARTRREAREVYEQTGQRDRYGRMLKAAMAAGAAGAALGLLMRNPLLAIVLAVGCYYIPLWLQQRQVRGRQRPRPDRAHEGGAGEQDLPPVVRQPHPLPG